MDEMDLLRKTLPAPEPSVATVEAGRRRLEELVRARSGAPAARSRPRWLLPGVGLTAAVAAATAGVVLVNVAQPAGPTARPGGAGQPGASRPATSPASPAPAVSAQDVLDTAATAARHAPSGSSGTYWYLRIMRDFEDGRGPQLEESWAKRDGESWFRGKDGELVYTPAGTDVLGPFFLAGEERTFTELQSLPTDPAALATWVTTNVAGHGGKNPGDPQPDPGIRQQLELDSYVQLISELPVPPLVRAAAFQAMGTLPGVTDMGPMQGGQGLRIATLGGHVVTLIIDPKTGRLLYTSFFVMPDSSEVFQGAPTATLTGTWTNKLG